jgi:hypothetical protein
MDISPVPVSHKIWFGTPNVPGLSQWREYISENANERSDFPTVGDNTHMSEMHVKRPLTIKECGQTAKGEERVCQDQKVNWVS